MSAEPDIECPFFTTSEAAAYLGYANASAVRGLIARSELEPDGRRGRNGPYLRSGSTHELAEIGAQL